jgi:hypothetical protein
LVAKEFSPPLTGSPNDIVVRLDGGPVFVERIEKHSLILESSEPIPGIVKLHRTDESRPGLFLIDIARALKAGRNILLPSGRLTLPIVDPETNRVRVLEYILGEKAAIRWNNVSQRPEWAGFIVKEAQNKKKPEVAPK